jgi:hypothetical protein
VFDIDGVLIRGQKGKEASYSCLGLRTASRLAGHVALVTGSKPGIGLGVANVLCVGCVVILTTPLVS